MAENEGTTEVVTFANPDVLSFYRELPFNFFGSPDDAARTIRKSDSTRAYPVLRSLFDQERRVLDVGCGAGWLVNSIDFHHRQLVHGIDFNNVAVEQAQAVNQILRGRAKFEVADLFTYQPTSRFDIVTSVGVLHHTDNCPFAVRRICRDYVRDGGHIFIGLYHSHGRKPFLEHFEKLKQQGLSEEELYQAYRKLHKKLKDETHIRSWFRDQVLHPHETQHTMKEMFQILQDEGVELLKTSINQFRPIENVDEIFELEIQMEKIGKEKLEQEDYYPGFFLFLGKKTSSSL